MKVIITLEIRARKRRNSYNAKKKHSSSKESKSTRRKVGYVAVFTYSTRRGALPEEASIHTTEMTAINEIKKSKDIRWVIHTDLLNSMLAIENNRENRPILNQI